MENVDFLISEEAQQDMDLKSAFAPAVPRQPFFRAILGDPKQSPGGSDLPREWPGQAMYLIQASESICPHSPLEAGR